MTTAEKTALPKATEIYDKRLGNLRAIMLQLGGPTRISEKLNLSNGSYIAQLAGPNPTRLISEKVARKLERGLELPHGYLDNPSLVGKLTHLGRSKSELDLPQLARKQQASSKTPPTPDTQLLIELVSTAHDVAANLNIKVPREKLPEVVNLTYEHAMEHDGAISHDYLRRLIRLTK